jgi:Zn-dependent protease
LLDLDFAQIFISLVVLLFALTVHEMAHAWTADRLGDPTARLLGRVSLNPMVHADPIGTLLFPILAAVSGVPLIGWAKPVPVNVSRLGHPRRDYMLVAAAGPASNVVLALASAVLLHVVPHAPSSIGDTELARPLGTLLARAVQLNVLLAVFNMIPIPPLDGSSVLAGLLPRRLAALFDLVRPYGFVLLYALMMSGALGYIVLPPYRALVSWLP